ncbi:hypothetical protein [Streptomyces sp. NPDC127084]|uniref:hypothetical protein n=1 Tax=Streptomyces sp. NPDC127084 TaxID=3347133 RepID=UPI00365F744E
MAGGRRPVPSVTMAVYGDISQEDSLVIPDPHRLKGGAAQLGATRPGEYGPFGVWPTYSDTGEHGDQKREEPEDGCGPA